MARSVSDDKIQADLSGRAWELCREALEKGRLTLDSGQIVVLQDRELLRHAQWLASLTAKKKSRTTLPIIKDDVELPQTR